MKMSCPACGLNVALDESRFPGGPPCPRCLTRSGGALSVWLTPRPPKPAVSRERRVFEFVRRQAGRALRV